jgi:hypothetical protein
VSKVAVGCDFEARVKARMASLRSTLIDNYVGNMIHGRGPSGDALSVVREAEELAYLVLATTNAEANVRESLKHEDSHRDAAASLVTILRGDTTAPHDS